MANRKIEALQEAAVKKAKSSAERVDKALERMILQNQIISFKSVAIAANVSTAYLYKQKDLRNRIETLRDQQKQKPKLKHVPPASDNSKNVIISNLREENKRLRAEIDELRKINEALTGKLYKLQGASDLNERLRAENDKLTKEVNGLQLKLANFESLSPQKVVPIAKGSRKISQISELIEKKLEELKVKLNPTLIKVILASREQEVIKALLSVEQYIQQNDISNIGGLVVEAIRERWEPNAPLKKQSQPQNNIDLIINKSEENKQNRETLALEELVQFSNIFLDETHG